MSGVFILLLALGKHGAIGEVIMGCVRLMAGHHRLCRAHSGLSTARPLRRRRRQAHAGADLRNTRLKGGELSTPLATGRRARLAAMTS